MAPIPSIDSYARIGVLFLLGGLATAVFSGSLVKLASNATLFEVLAIGLIVPSFTWIAQLAASAVGLPPDARLRYWGDLGRVCLLGSVALLPAAAVNLLTNEPQMWVSAANVLASAALMGADLFRQTRAHGLAIVWPVSWCLTIAANIALFCWVSRDWW